MNVTDEDKKIGRENFAAAIGNKAVRGEFLTKQVQQGLSSGKGLGSYYYGYGKSVASRVRVGVLGTGDEGSVLIGAINPDFIEVKAIADIRPYNVHRAFHGDYYSASARAVRPGLLAKYGWKTEDEGKKNVKVYADYRDLVKESKALGIEAVIIALPLHLHAPAAIAAMKAGLHVLTEKLMGHSVHECKEMARVAAQTKLLLATGHQRHYNILYDNAVELIRKGVLGDLHYIRAQWHRDNQPGKDSWQPPLPPGAKDPKRYRDADDLAKDLAKWEEAYKENEAELAKLVKDKKTKEADDLKKKMDEALKRLLQKRAQAADKEIIDKAKDYGYEHKVIKDAKGELLYDVPPIEELIRWRLWDRTGGGLMAELGSHQLDAASIFIQAMLHENTPGKPEEKIHPLCVMAAGNRPLFPPDRDIEDHVYCVFEFPGLKRSEWDKADEATRRMKRISVAYASINGNGFGGYGETVFGTEGTLVLETEKEAMLWKTHSTDEHIRLATPKDKPPKIELLTKPDQWDAESAALGEMATVVSERGYTEEIEHWAWCIRNPAPENQPRCGPKVALGDAVIALTTNMAAQKGERIDFKPEWFDPDSNETPEDVVPNPARYA